MEIFFEDLSVNVYGKLSKREKVLRVLNIKGRKICTLKHFPITISLVIIGMPMPCAAIQILSNIWNRKIDDVIIPQIFSK